MCPAVGRAGVRAGVSAASYQRGWRGWYQPSGGLRGGDGDGAAGAELFQLAQQVGAALVGGFPLGVEVGAQVFIRFAALEHLVGDLQQGVGDREIAFFTAAGFFGPPNRRTSLWYLAWRRPWVLIADQAACTSIGLM